LEGDDMVRSRILAAALVLLCVVIVSLSGSAVHAHSRQQVGRGPERVRACNIRSSRIVTVAPSAVQHSPVLTEDLSRCASDTDPFRSGVLATFDVVGEQFRVWVTNPTTIEQLFALQAGTSTASIPTGVIHTGAGTGDHNAPWNWHLDPEQIEMAEITIEVCDARPSYVEANLTDFIETVGQYCPWMAKLVGLEDHR
jgi:hypothetical protein